MNILSANSPGTTCGEQLFITVNYRRFSMGVLNDTTRCRERRPGIELIMAEQTYYKLHVILWQSIKDYGLPVDGVVVLNFLSRNNSSCPTTHYLLHSHCAALLIKRPRCGFYYFRAIARRCSVPAQTTSTTPPQQQKQQQQQSSQKRVLNEEPLYRQHCRRLSSRAAQISNEPAAD